MSNSKDGSLSDETSGDDFVTTQGGNVSEILDGSNGGNDTLRGGNGGDVYLFGYNSDHDVVDEGYRNFGSLGDIVRLENGITASNISLSRDIYDLVLNLSDSSGTVADTLTIKNYYVSNAAKIERVELSDGTEIFNVNDFATVSWTPPSYTTAEAEVSGDTSGVDSIEGEDYVNDIFDADAGGNDELYGYSGDDVYWLGVGTDHDRIIEYSDNDSGDAGDVIKIKEKREDGITDIEVGDIRLERSSNGYDLIVQLVDSTGTVTDSLRVDFYYDTVVEKIERLEFFDGTVWDSDEFSIARIRGDIGNDVLQGSDDLNDVFDGDAGGDDILRGRGGDDVYWLGNGTGHDVIQEYYNNDSDGDADDVIEIKETYADGSTQINESDIEVIRNGNDLLVKLINRDGSFSDSLTVENYYTDDSANIESIKFADGTVWDSIFIDNLISPRIRGDIGNEELYGDLHLSDVFDADAGGNDVLFGYGGNDVYWLGAGTDHDIINEEVNDGDDNEDVIKIEEGYGTDDIRLSRDGFGKENLAIQLLGDPDANGDRDVTDSLKLLNYFIRSDAKIENIDFFDGTLWNEDEIMIRARIRGTAVTGENLIGTDNVDVFDSDAGGNDTLSGLGGSDVYRLGDGTDHDTIRTNSGVSDFIEIEDNYGADDIRLERSNDGTHLIILLLGDEIDASGYRVATDSLTVENYYISDTPKIRNVEFANETVALTEWLDEDDFLLARIRGTNAGDVLEGLANFDDTFDSDAGSDDTLSGLGGNDVYWLGAGTGNDTILGTSASDAGDVIKIKAGYGVGDVRTSRDENDTNITIQLLGVSDANGARSVTDSLTVVDYYGNDPVQIESVKFNDGTEWTIYELSEAPSTLWIRGTSVDDTLEGTGNKDVFESNVGGDDILRGGGGDDVYWLGIGTDNDIIEAHYNNSGSSTILDKIKIQTGFGEDNVSLGRSSNGSDLIVQLLDDAGEETGDSLTVDNYYTDASAKIEAVEFFDGTVWSESDFISAPIRGTSSDTSLYGADNVDDVFDSNAGGNNNSLLYGYSGNDVYWLGAGTYGFILEYSDSNGNVRQGDGDNNDVIKIKQGFGTDDIRLERIHSNLSVQLLDDAGEVTGDSLTVVFYYENDSAKIEAVESFDGTVLWDASDFALLRIIGVSGDDDLYGSGNFNDVFDGNAGGDDTLYGYGGDDVYWLGAGTDHDTIKEYKINIGDSADVIKIKEGLDSTDIVLGRSGDGNSLIVRLLGVADANGNRAITDSLTVENYYTDDSAKIESVEFTNGTVWSADDFIQERIIRGTSVDENLYGTNNMTDVFDSDAGGGDVLYGYSGNDEYGLGAGTDNDVIREYLDSSAIQRTDSGDPEDVIKIEEGYGTYNIRLERSGDDLVVTLLDGNGFKTNDSLTVENYYINDSAKIESIEFNDGTVWSANDIDYHSSAIRGTSNDENLYGAKNESDIFDADAGGNDNLRGFSGNDVYWLGAGTGHDVIQEYYYNLGNDGDLIKIEEGFGTDNVFLEHSSGNGLDLIVTLLDDDGFKTEDSLTVKLHFADPSASYYHPYMQGSTIEGIEFNDGTVWSANNIDSMLLSQIRGTSSDENLHGENDVVDVFNSDAGGNDNLRGRSGNDVYWLGDETDNDVIHEYYYNLGDDGDLIKIEEGYGINNVRLELSSNGLDLIVKLLDGTGAETGDSLTVDLQFADSSASYYKNYMQGSAVEQIEADGHVLLSTQYTALINEMSLFEAGASSFSNIESINDHYWQDKSTIANQA